MKCLKQGFLMLLLTALLVSPLYAGWDGFKNGFSTSSNGSSEDAQETMETEEQSQTQSSTEAIVESKQTEKLLDNLEQNSGSYEAKLEDAKEAIAVAEETIINNVDDERPKKLEEKKEAVEEAKAIVDDLIASKAALDEDHDILVETVIAQNKIIARQDRKLDGLNFGLGGMYNQVIKFNELGLDAISKLNPSVLFGMRYRDWEILLGLGAVFDFSNGAGNAFRNMEEMTVSIGGVYWF